MSHLAQVYFRALRSFQSIKGGSTQDMNNYHPISLISIFDKIIEKLMHMRLYNCMATTLNQRGRPVAFFSCTLSPAERRHSSVEKEAYAVVESVLK